jgi:acetyl esterase
MEQLTLGTRLIGRLLQYSPSFSIATMTLEQIERSQDPAAMDSNGSAARITSLILGGVQTGVSTTDRAIDGPAGRLPVRIYTPNSATPDLRPLIVYYHGGGWVLGTLSASDWLCSTIARDVDAVVVSVDYRLAPTHKFPAAVEDCYAALEWSHGAATELRADPERLGLMGDSAGGNLAAVTALLVAELGGPALKHLALLYPVTDGSMSTASYRENRDAIILSAADMAAFYGYYLPPDANALDWRVSPLYAPDLSGLPPTMVIIAGHDPLRDEGAEFARKLTAAGVPVTLKTYPAMPHGFISFPRFSRDARPAVAELATSQRASLS